MVRFFTTDRIAMNLNIELAWCRHWVREQLGLNSSDSIVLFVCDSRDPKVGLSQTQREAMQAIMTEMRWQFSNPVSVLLSIVEKSVKTSRDPYSFHYREFCGIIDHQLPVDNASDLCGWIGACNTLFSSFRNRSDLEEKLIRVASGFQVPMNLIPNDAGAVFVDELDWEHIHQARLGDPMGMKNPASMDFSSAVLEMDRVLGGQVRLRHAG